MIEIKDIEAAANAIRGQIVKTPLLRSATLSDRVDGDVWLKLECLQTTGSFKLRGALNAVANLSEYEKSCGVTCVSTGNHGRGLAYGAKQNGIRAIVCMGSLVPQNKIDGIQALGAEVRIIGDSQEQAQVEVDRLVSEEGMTMVPPFDHPDIIAGQGTIALEILDELDKPDTVIVPLSGGGLCGGVALGIKSLSPKTRVIGCSMDRGAAMHESVKAGKPVDVEEFPSLADALGGGINDDNTYTLELIQQYVDDIVLVSENDIADGIRHMYFQEQQIVEGSAAVGVAALLSGKIDQPGTTAVVISGKNINMDRHQQVINGVMPDL